MTPHLKTGWGALSFGRRAASPPHWWQPVEVRHIRRLPIPHEHFWPTPKLLWGPITVWHCVDSDFSLRKCVDKWGAWKKSVCGNMTSVALHRSCMYLLLFVRGSVPSVLSWVTEKLPCWVEVRLIWLICALKNILFLCLKKILGEHPFSFA